MASFLLKERVHVGWRFLVLWLALTNIGFVVGLGIEFALFQSVNTAIAILLTAFLQAWVLDRHLPIAVLWTIGTVVFWWIGAFASIQIIGMATPDVNIVARVGFISLLGGVLIGIPQWLLLREWIPQVRWWWLGVSALSWLGIVPGLALMRYIERFEFIDDPDKRYDITTEQVEDGQAKGQAVET